VTADDLAEECGIASANMARQYVSYLRRRLAGTRFRIHTEHGRGYTLQVDGPGPGRPPSPSAVSLAEYSWSIIGAIDALLALGVQQRAVLTGLRTLTRATFSERAEQ
jgi:hypothetical protein